MKIKGYCLLSLLASTASLCFFGNSKETVGDSVDPTEIGTFYTYQRVATRQKVYVLGESISWAIACNRELFQELVLPNNISNLDNQNAVQLTPQTTGEINYQPFVSYYYWADSNSPIITGAQKLYNTLDSFLFVLEYMEDEVSYQGIPDANNAILGYIRSINKDYATAGSYLGLVDTFRIVCGPYESSIATFFQTPFSGGGISVRDYFACFVSAQNYYAQYHGATNDIYLQTHVELLDPVGDGTIDLIHMMACIDGVGENTGETTSQYVYLDSVTKDTFRHLISWGGDLQQAALAVSNAGITNFSFETILSGQFNFSHSDLLADVDGFSMALDLDLSGSNIILSEIIGNYYDSILFGDIERFSFFVSKVADTAQYEFLSEESAFAYDVCDMMKMNTNGQNIYVYPYVAAYKYHIMGYGNINVNFPSETIRWNMALSFYNYIVGD